MSSVNVSWNKLKLPTVLDCLASTADCILLWKSQSLFLNVLEDLLILQANEYT